MRALLGRRTGGAHGALSPRHSARGPLSPVYFACPPGRASIPAPRCPRDDRRAGALGLRTSAAAASEASNGRAHLDVDGRGRAPETLANPLLHAGLPPSGLCTRTDRGAGGVWGDDREGRLQPPVAVERPRAHADDGERVQHRRRGARAAIVEGRGKVGGQRKAEREGQNIGAWRGVGVSAGPEGEVGVDEWTGVAQRGSASPNCALLYANVKRWKTNGDRRRTSG